MSRSIVGIRPLSDLTTFVHDIDMVRCPAFPSTHEMETSLLPKALKKHEQAESILQRMKQHSAAMRQLAKVERKYCSVVRFQLLHLNRNSGISKNSSTSSASTIRSVLQLSTKQRKEAVFEPPHRAAFCLPSSYTYIAIILPCT